MERRQFDVVVVGGGVSGISSALVLAKRGLKVALVESRSILGGRARSWIDGVTRDPVHIGPHVVVTEYFNFFHLLELLGTRDKIIWQPWRHFITWVSGAKEHHIRTLPLPAPFSWGIASMLDPFASYADKHSTVPAAMHCLNLSDEEVLALDNETGEQFLRRLGVSDAYIQHFWGFLSHAILNVPVNEVSATAMVQFFRRLVGRSSMEMGFSDGGLGDLLTPAKQVLTDLGAEIFMGAEVTGFLGYTSCDGVQLDDGSSLIASLGVISSLPPQTLLPLLPSAWKLEVQHIKELAKLKPCEYLSVYIWFDRKVSQGKQMWARISDDKNLNCEFYDFSEIYTGLDSKGVEWKKRPSFIGSNIIDSGRLTEMTDDQIVKATIGELSEFLAEVKEAKVLHSVVNRVPMAIHRPVAGTERLRPDQRSQIPGLYFAGCWTKTQFPSSMEAAARSGFMAAERLLETQGITAEIAISYPQMELGARMLGKLDILRPMVWSPFFRGLSRLSGGSHVSKL